MKALCKTFSFAFTGGCIGGLITSLLLWMCGQTELAQHFNVKLSPTLTMPWLYQTAIWGGLYATLFLMPFLRRSYFFRGILYSFVPSFVQLFIILPFIEHQGFLGMNLGDLTPVFITVINLFWGISAGLWLQYTEK
jgi:hypothetical protein